MKWTTSINVILKVFSWTISSACSILRWQCTLAAQTEFNKGTKITLLPGSARVISIFSQFSVFKCLADPLIHPNSRWKFLLDPCFYEQYHIKISRTELDGRSDITLNDHSKDPSPLISCCSEMKSFTIFTAIFAISWTSSTPWSQLMSF